MRSRTAALLIPVILLLVPATALGFHEPATAEPAVAKPDRALYRLGSKCLNQANKAASGIYNQTGGLAAYMKSAKQLTNRSKACVQKVKRFKAKTEVATCAKKPLAQSFNLYRKSGVSFQRAARASAAGKQGRATKQARKGDKQFTRANTVLSKADSILRGKVACKA